MILQTIFLTTILVVITEQRPPVFVEQEEDLLRPVRSIQNEEEITTANEETTLTSEDIRTSTTADFLAEFVKISARAMEDPIEKRSIKEEQSKEEDNLEDLDTAANTVFRPLFAYRQQNAQRRRLRQLKYS